MRLSGAYITNITVSFCPKLDTTFAPKKGFSLSDLRPKQILWSILGVGTVVGIGIICGLMVNYIKEFFKKTIRNEPIRYVNINDELA